MSGETVVQLKTRAELDADAWRAQVEKFKAAFPGQWQQCLDEGAAAERARWRAIEAVAEGLGPDHAPLVKAMKADGRCTGADLAQAVVAMQQQRWGAETSDRLAIQRAAKETWAADEWVRHAFNDDRAAYIAYRVATVLH